MIDSQFISDALFFPRKMKLHFNLQKNILPLSFTMMDGIQLTGLFFSDKKENRTILFFHGNAELANDYHSHFGLFKSASFNFAVIDFRGYGSSQGSPFYSSLFTDPPIVFSQFRRWLKENKYNDEIVIMGRSLGGVCACALGAENPAGLVGIILESVYSNLVDLYYDLYPQNASSLPDQMLHTLQKWSNDKYIPKIIAPTLLIHGENDDIIPIYHAEKNINILKKSAEATLRIIKRARHNDILTFKNEYIDALDKFVSNLN